MGWRKLMGGDSKKNLLNQDYNTYRTYKTPAKDPQKAGFVCSVGSVYANQKVKKNLSEYKKSAVELLLEHAIGIEIEAGEVVLIGIDEIPEAKAVEIRQAVQRDKAEVIRQARQVRTVRIIIDEKRQ